MAEDKNKRQTKQEEKQRQKELKKKFEQLRKRDPFTYKNF